MPFSRKKVASRPKVAEVPQAGRIKVRQPGEREALRGSPQPPNLPKKKEEK